MRIWLYTFFILLFTSCRIEVQDEFPDFPKHAAVNAFLAKGEPLQVHVSLATKLDTSPLGIVDNAEVSLYVNQVFRETLTYTDSGLYRSSIIAEAGKEYSCKVKVPGYEALSCSQLMPEVPVLKAIEHINIAGKDEEGTSFPAVKITFQNQPGQLAYYEIEMRIIFNRQGTDIRPAEIHTIVDPVILNEGLPMALFSNELIADSLYTITLNYTTNQASSRGGAFRTTLFPMVLEFRKVTVDYYRFKKQLFLYEQGRFADGIISGMTNTNLYSNIDQGYGIFAAYSAVLSDTIKPNTDGYYQ